MENNRNRLTILNEVLPAPTPTARGNVRERVLLRLKKLSGLVGASSVSACIGYGVVDPLPPPAGECSLQPADAWISNALFVQSEAPRVRFMLNSQISGVTFKTAFSSNATITATSTPTANVLDVSFTPNPDVRFVHMGIEMDCGGQDGTAHFQLDMETLAIDPLPGPLDGGFGLDAGNPSDAGSGDANP